MFGDNSSADKGRRRRRRHCVAEDRMIYSVRPWNVRSQPLPDILMRISGNSDRRLLLSNPERQ